MSVKYVTERDVMNAGKEKPGKRIKHARKLRGVEVPDLAGMIGIPAQSIYAIERGETDSSKYIPIIAAELDIHPMYLTTGKGRIFIDLDSEKLPELTYDVHALFQYRDPRFMNNPAYGDRTATELDEIPIPRFVFNDLKLQHNMCFGDIADENDMYPTIKPGDRICVNTLEGDLFEAENNSIYAFLQLDKISYRRIKQTLDGRIRLICDNSDKSDFPDIYIDKDDTDTVTVIGRARWIGSFI